MYQHIQCGRNRLTHFFTPPKIIKAILFSLLLLAFSPYSMAAQKATASVSNNQIQPGETFSLTITYNDSASNNDLDMRPLSKNFNILSKGFSSSFKWINGDSQRVVTWKYNLSPKTNQLGNVQIPSLSINGSKTDPITLTIAEAPKDPAMDKLASMVTEISSQSLYPQQTAVLSMTLTIRSDLNYYQPTLVPPTSQDLTIEAIDDLQTTQQIINGVSMDVHKQNFIVKSDKTGSYTIEPSRFNSTIYVKNRRLPLNVSSDAITVTVNDIPKDYQGVWLPVEDLVFHQTWLDPDGELLDPSKPLELTQGQPITRQLEVEIPNTPAESFPQLKIDYPDSVRVYTDKPIYTQDDGYIVMVLKQVIIPNQAGEFTLPDVRIPWWNSKQNKQEIAQVDAQKIIVKSDGTTVAPPATSNSNDAVSTDSNAPQTTQPSTPSGDPSTSEITPDAQTKEVTPSKLWFYIACALALLVLILIALLVWIMRRVSSLEHSSEASKINKKTKANNAKNPSVQAMQATQTLIDSLQSNDGMTIQQAYQAWKNQYTKVIKHPDHADLAKEIEQEMNLLMATFYGKDSQTYEPSHLKTLIEKASAIEVEDKDDGLAKL